MDLQAGVYDADDNQVFLAKLSTGTIEHLGNNVYRAEIPHSVTKSFEGKYYMDILVKSPNGTEYVNIGETPVKLNFKKAPISKNLS